MKLQKLKLKFYGLDKYENELIRLENLINKLKSGMMNELDNPELKNEISEIDLLFTKLKKINE